MWRCPICAFKLTPHLKTWTCDNHHHFDVAKQGYVNLLPVQQKKSKQPGDNKEMVLARQTFLNAGHYFPLAEEVTSIIVQHHQNLTKDKDTSDVKINAQEVDDESLNGNLRTYSHLDSIRIYDSGCGEGYYLDSVQKLLKPLALHGDFAGHDISKDAVTLAAKRSRDIQYVVASSKSVPLLSASQDIVLQVFAPSHAKESARVLNKLGILIRVEPNASHLFELKRMIYDKASEHPTSTLDSSFNLLEVRDLTFSLRLESEESRLSLLKMTPYYWSSSESQKIDITERLHTATASFRIKVLQPN